MQCKSNKETKIKNQIVTCTEHMYSFNKIIDNQVKKMQLTIMPVVTTPLGKKLLIWFWTALESLLSNVQAYKAS